MRHITCCIIMSISGRHMLIFSLVLALNWLPPLILEILPHWLSCSSIQGHVGNRCCSSTSTFLHDCCQRILYKLHWACFNITGGIFYLWLKLYSWMILHWDRKLNRQTILSTSSCHLRLHIYFPFIVELHKVTLPFSLSTSIVEDTVILLNKLC